ncbi:Centromere DNA-binding protein complex CBF3 subunit C [Nakaseomyces bracarensis]|uniref:Centromere DNA-binding protein complex CBF3 subunit C n=1 Tax=Nakaseomyces bracarensis TaxID=273131 RepID=A0ABR4NY37_9SACH
MGEQVFNTLKFLDLPYEIRKHVYYHLDGIFTNANPPKVEDLYRSNLIELPEVRKGYGSKRRKQYFKTLIKRFYPIFKPYLSIFQYSPLLIETWLDYSQWLRYDAIVLDCLRLNHLYDGTLIGPMDWVILDSKPKLAYINNLYMLQVWYSFHEYRNLVLQVDKEDILTERIEYSRINLENQDFDSVRLLINMLKETNRLKLISEVFIGDNKIDKDTVHSCIVDQMPIITKKRSRTPDIDIEQPLTAKKERYHIPNNTSVLLLIENFDYMKSLVKLGVRGASLFESLVNTHGVRDNPGQTISYITRRQILSILISQIENPSTTGLADFSKWVNLREIIIENCGKVDLNSFVVPPRVVSLIVKHVRNLRWWNFELLNEFSKYITAENMMKYKSINRTISRTNIIKRDHISLSAQKIMRISIWSKLGSINSICLSDILHIENHAIIIPKSLFDEKRFLILSDCNSSNLILF